MFHSLHAGGSVEPLHTVLGSFSRVQMTQAPRVSVQRVVPFTANEHGCFRSLYIKAQVLCIPFAWHCRKPRHHTSASARDARQANATLQRLSGKSHNE